MVHLGRFIKGIEVLQQDSNGQFEKGIYVL